MQLIDVREANGQLTELVKKAVKGEEVILTEDGQPCVKLVVMEPVLDPALARQPRKPGSAIGKILYIAPDFDAPLEDFKDYM
ncbi:MAG: type II toxin-antitoxin system prevent-host-death family antitoxin [Magnetococcales bacterium]|nr:type II toxin-antitoxin system prevent-host-death family antitoxin [Magnetococcales bacterium]